MGSTLTGARLATRRHDEAHDASRVSVDSRLLDGLVVLAGAPPVALDVHPFVVGDELANWCGRVLGSPDVVVLREDEVLERSFVPAELLTPHADEVRWHLDGDRCHVRLRIASTHHELDVVISGRIGRPRFDPTLVDMLVARIRSIGLMADHYEAVAASSRVDPLTGLGNRAVADRAIARLGPGDGLIVLDLDGLKALNDSRGHAEGDRVLRDLGRMLLDEVRVADVVARYGGDEVVVVLRAGGDHTALADRLVRTWSRRGSGTTLSAGLAVCQRDEHPRSVFLRADDALYRAKRRGRDRLEVG